MKFFILFIFLSGFLGCSTSHQVDLVDGYIVEQDQKNGLVVLSFTKSGVRDIPFFLSYRGIGANNQGVYGKIPVLGNYDWQLSDSSNISSKGSYEGRVVLLKLPAGQYEFYDLIIEDGYQDAEWSGGRRFSIPFKSTLAATEYVGNVHVWSKETGDLDVSYEYYHTDERVRDIALFRKKYSNMGEVFYSLYSSPTNELISSKISSKLSAEQLKLLSIEPQDAEAHKNRAALYISLEEYEKVEYHLEKALSLDDTLADAYAYRSILHLKNENVNKSLADTNSAIKYDPNNAIGLLIRSFIRYAIGEKQAAKLDYKRAIEINPALAERFGDSAKLKELLGDL